MKTILGLSEWKTRVSDAFSTARYAGMQHARILDLLDRNIYSELNRKWSNGRRVYSAYVSGYVSGLIALHYDFLYLQHLEFCYVGADGTKYSTHKNRPRTTEEFYSTGRGHELNNMPNGHFWIESGRQFSNSLAILGEQNDSDNSML